MIPAHVVTVTTPKKYLLNGLWYGNPKAKTGVVFLHGLTSSAFALREILDEVAGQNVAVLAVSNRGNAKVTKIKQLNSKKPKGYDTQWMGEALEVFTDCVDDIQGAVNFLKQQGCKQIFLLGHSTGCQKSIYYLSRPGKQAAIAGAILLCPLSDYAWAIKNGDKAKLNKAIKHAKRLVGAGKPSEFLPPGLTDGELYSAQRFLSLYTPDSPEEIFTYWDQDHRPSTYQKVKVPLLVVLAGADEYGDRPASEIADWFEQNTRIHSLATEIIDGALHNLGGKEKEVSNSIKLWIKNLLNQKFH